ncbi:MAG TPA: ribonuclease Z [Hyphomicrobium sp.]|nr:ribonuclease Z [Hyphomicrobium sp.]
MAKYFDPQLINGPFDDPGLFIDLVFERRAILFDIGDLSLLPPRKILRIAHVFVTHRHMDHFIGFDQLLRCQLGRDKTICIWGPPGLICAIENKLNAYDWNLIAGYEGNLRIHASELSLKGELTSARFCGVNRFAREDLGGAACNEGVLVTEPGFTVRAAYLEHGIPVLAFALEERVRLNICRSRLVAMGLAVGPWLNAFKEAILAGEDPQKPIRVLWAHSESTHAPTLPLGILETQIMKTTRGRKIAYVVDAAYTQQNADAIAALARDSDILYIEAHFLQEDAEQATARRHLTAAQAGALAGRANVKLLRTFHYSPRYRGREIDIVEEAETAFHGRTRAAASD